MFLWWSLACSGGDDTSETDTTPTDDPQPHTSTETGDTSTTPTDEIQATVFDGPINTMRGLHVTLATPAAVAGRCVSTTDPAEILFDEDTAVATQHELRFAGLLPETTYDCRVVVPGDPSVPTASVAMTSGEKPGILPAMQVTVNPKLGMTGAFTLGPFYERGCQGEGRQGWLALWDADGQVRWWKRLPDGVAVDVEALYHPEIDSIVWGGGDSKKGPVTIEPMWSDTPSYSSEKLDGVGDIVFHHDGVQLEDGTILTLELDPVVDGAATWQGFRIRRHDPTTGQVLLDVHSQQFYDQGYLSPWKPGTLEDAWHANALHWRETKDGPLLFVSLCFEQAILVILGNTGELLMRLDSTWEMHDADGSRLGGWDFPQCQHGIEAIDDDLLMVYDNGRHRRETRLEFLRVDRPAHTITREWMWTDERYESSGGDVDLLDNGRVLSTFCHMECLEATPSLNEVMEIVPETGEVASKMTLTDKDNILYRTQRYGGCEVLPGTRYCASAMSRATELGSLFDR